MAWYFSVKLVESAKYHTEYELYWQEMKKSADIIIVRSDDRKKIVDVGFSYQPGQSHSAKFIVSLSVSPIFFSFYS